MVFLLRVVPWLVFEGVKLAYLWRPHSKRRELLGCGSRERPDEAEPWSEGWQ